MKHSHALQTWLDQAVAFRTDMLQSETRFFEYLIQGEQGACPWQGQYPSFEALLHVVNLTSVSRYTSFRDAYARHNNEVVKDIDALGVDGVVEAARIQEDPKRLAFIARVAHGAKMHGCPLSQRQIKAIGREISPLDRPQRGPQELHDIKKLQAENKALRTENAQLKAQNARLQAQLEARPAKKTSKALNKSPAVAV